MYVTHIARRRKEKAILLETELEDISIIDSFEFDWSKEADSELYRLELRKSGEILGLMALKFHFIELRVEISLLELSKNNVGRKKQYENVAGILIASACKISFKLGFFGFVSLIPKTQLIEHYKTKYGFDQFGRQLAVDLKNSELLIEKYLENEE